MEKKAQLVFGIAGIGDEHLGLLAKISEIIEDPERLEQLKINKKSLTKSWKCLNKI